MLSFRAGVRAFPCAGAALLSLGGLPLPPRVGLLGASRCTFASLRPQLGSRPPLRIRSWWGCGKSAPISTYPQFVFHRLVHPVEKLFTTPCVFHRLSVFPPQGAPSPSRRVDEKCPSRAYIYNIGAAKGEEGSAPSAAFRCGRGGLGARGADRWPRPMDKGLAGGQGARKGVGERTVRGAAGAAIGRRQAKVPGGAHGVCTRVATVGEEEGSPGRCACTIRAQRQVELPNEVCKL